MRPRDLFGLVLLAFLWGGSFLLVRTTVPEFGPVPVAGLRIGFAAAFLLPILWLRGGLQFARGHLRALALVGLFNAAVPFALYAYAMQTLTTGYAAILNAVTPLFTALVGLLWLRDRLTAAQVLGLALGFTGVVVLVQGRIDLKPGGTGLAVIAALLASVQYGAIANYIKHRLALVPALATSAVSLAVGALALLPFTIAAWPEHLPDTGAWLRVAALGVFCTALGYVQFFRLLARVGATRAITVTFLVPATAMLWGFVFLNEVVTWNMLVGCAVILAGTTLVTGVFARRGVRAAAITPET